jgi:outer membrane protein OmpA-like peptidoglycan-associated protein
MKLLPLFLLGLLGLFFIALLSVKFNKPIIESELTENTHEALLSEGMDWATPSANGQTITLKGIADNNELRLHAESIAQAVNGVAQVNNQLTVSSIDNTTYQAEQIMVNEGDEVVDSISAITTESSAFIEPITEIAETEAEVAVIVEEAIEPVIDIVETEGVTEEFIEPIESVEFATEIAETEVVVVTEEVIEPIESVEPVTEIAETEVTVVATEMAETGIVVDELTITEVAEKETPEAITMSEPINEVLNTCQQQFDELLTNEKIRFETNSAILSEGNNQLLEKLVEVIQSCPAFKIVIEGHTDADGEVVANQILSEQRAYRVYDELVKRGIRSFTLLAIGYGESRPLNTDNTAASKAQNRRIELNVEEN